MSPTATRVTSNVRRATEYYGGFPTSPPRSSPRSPRRHKQKGAAAAPSRSRSRALWAVGWTVFVLYWLSSFAMLLRQRPRHAAQWKVEDELSSSSRYQAAMAVRRHLVEYTEPLEEPAALSLGQMLTGRDEAKGKAAGMNPGELLVLNRANGARAASRNLQSVSPEEEQASFGGEEGITDVEGAGEAAAASGAYVNKKVNPRKDLKKQLCESGHPGCEETAAEQWPQRAAGNVKGAEGGGNSEAQQWAAQRTWRRTRLTGLLQFLIGDTELKKPILPAGGRGPLGVAFGSSLGLGDEQRGVGLGGGGEGRVAVKGVYSLRKVRAQGGEKRRSSAVSGGLEVRCAAGRDKGNPIAAYVDVAISGGIKQLYTLVMADGESGSDVADLRLRWLVHNIPGGKDYTAGDVIVKDAPDRSTCRYVLLLQHAQVSPSESMENSVELLLASSYGQQVASLTAACCSPSHGQGVGGDSDFASTSDKV